MSENENIKNYDLRKSIERLLWRFSKDENEKTKSFYPNTNDLKALQNITTWIGRQKSETITNNQLFAKLYLYHFTDLMRKYDAIAFDVIIEKELSSLLDRPLESFFKAFYNDLITRQFETNNIRRLEKGLMPIDEDEFKANYPYEVAKTQMLNVITEALNRLS